MRGHITKRSKDSWAIVLDAGRDPASGKRRQQWHTVKGTKREAEKRLADSALPPSSCNFIARQYLIWESKGERPNYLDQFLALRLWDRLEERNVEKQNVYEEAG